MIDKQVIRDFLSTLTNKAAHVGDDDSLLEAKILDSLMIAQLVVFLEDHYKVTFDSDDLSPDNLDTINAMAGFLERKGIA
jgi:acyl carrier protein